MSQTNKSNEIQRVKASRLLDRTALSSETFVERTAAIVAKLCQAPFALLAVKDIQKRRWVLTQHGFHVPSLSSDDPLFKHVANQTKILSVFDVAGYETLTKSSLVCSGPCVRSFAGLPLTSHNGLVIGVMLVMDHQPTSFTAEKENIFRIVGEQVIAYCNLRSQTADLDQKVHELEMLREKNETLTSLVEFFPDGVYIKDNQGRYVIVNPAALEFLGVRREDKQKVLGHKDKQVVPTERAHLIA